VHVGLDISTATGFYIAITIGVTVAVVGKVAISRLKIDPEADREMHFNNVEKIFGILMITTACCMAFAHGSNDVANAIGPVAAVVSVVTSGGEIASKATLAPWVLPLGAIGIVIGLATLGARVIKTIGTAITHLTPSRGFAAELSAASTVVIASGAGLPISTTQTLVGAVLGVGLARGIAALNLGVVRNIFISWVITLPVGAGLAVIFFYLLRAIFS
jgi:inorganic phosphate transporter, PiT family